MRIEKINDHQIRCTLNQKDLSERELRISELAYGTDKAKSLFRDMMQQASYEFGFEADDIPLMIEAIPMYPDTLVLLITKVDDPEELDTRFSRFTEDSENFDMGEDSVFTIEEDLGDPLMSGLHDEENEDYNDSEESNILLSDTDQDKGSDFISLSEALGMERRPKTTESGPSHDLIKIYSFQTLKEVSSLAEYLVYSYSGQNTLYKDEKQKCYYLIIHKSDHTPEEFNRICNIICEYGKPVRNTYASHFYYEEHYAPLIKDKALQVLASI